MNLTVAHLTDALRRWTLRPEPRCPAALTLSGRKYPCQSSPDHPWAHHNKDAEAVWHGR